MTNRVYNFSAGPAVLPLPVLEQAQSELVALPGVGMSVMEISHRSQRFIDTLDSAKARLRSLLSISDEYEILFLQGGSRLQFSMVPINLAKGTGRPASYILTGAWGVKAIEEAAREGEVHIAWDGESTAYDRLPTAGDLQINSSAAYMHFTSNETIEGVQFLAEPEVGDVPLVADCSSDFLCRPLPVEKYGLIYACAQKNAGPAGLTVVIMRKDLLERGDDNMAGYLRYKNHADHDSMWNTPPTFAIYIFDLVAKWLQDDIGGLAAMERQNRAKAQMLYEVIDESVGFYRPHSQPDSRSIMNVTFRLPSNELQEKFLAGAKAHRLMNLKGHRSVGGIRASIYNAQPVEGVEALRDYMRDFCRENA